MLKRSGAEVGDKTTFTIEQYLGIKQVPMPKQFKKKLDEHVLLPAFQKLTTGRQKEIQRYLNHLKTEEAFLRNIEKVISGLKKKNNLKIP